MSLAGSLEPASGDSTARCPSGMMAEPPVPGFGAMTRHVLPFVLVLLALAVPAAVGQAGPAAASGDCGTRWYSAHLTNYESYPDPGSAECTRYSGCRWAGYFYGLEGRQSLRWVQDHNIVAVHSKDWRWLGLKTLRLRQGDHRIAAKVYDACSDADCDNCCTANLGGDGYLIDIEKHTMERFGAGDGIVEFQVCD